ncbi:hypothetical protein SEUCBS139899_007914 [Sporothrix eucalyptigena]
MNNGSYDMPARDRGGQDRQHAAHEGGGRAGRGAPRPPGLNPNIGVPNNINVDYNSHANMAVGNVYEQGARRQLNTKCKDVDCNQPIAWRNLDSSGSIIGYNGNQGRNSNFHHNQEDREIQMKLLDILSETGLQQNELAVLGSMPLAFSTLPPVSSSSGSIHGMPNSTGMEAPQQRSVSWLCAQFDAERDKREWLFYNRAKTAARIPSLYCEEHAICPAFRCTEGKGQYVDPSHTDQKCYKFLRHEFCSKHLCQVEGCELLCDQFKKDQIGNFCPKHKCNYMGCANQAQARLGYCAKHKCQSASCTKLATTGYKICKKHRAIDDKDYAECGIEIYDREPYLSYCKAHGTCAENACSKLRIKATIHCRKHACLELGCHNPSPDKLKYCNKHRCMMDDCTSPKGWKQDGKTREDYCSNHLCRETPCSMGVPSMHLFCEYHECIFEACISVAAKDGHCVEHLKIDTTKRAKAAVHRETQQWAKTFQGNNGHVANGMYYAQPAPGPMVSPFSPAFSHHPFGTRSISTRHSMSSRSGSPPDHDYNRGRDRGKEYYDQDHGRRGSRRPGRGSAVHTPTSSDGVPSQYGDDSDDSPVRKAQRHPQQQRQQQQPQQQQQRPSAAHAATAALQQNRPQQPPVVNRPASQAAMRVNGNGNGNNGGGGNGTDFVFLGKAATPPNSGNAGHKPPIILQHQPVYHEEDDYDNWVQ